MSNQAGDSGRCDRQRPSAAPPMPLAAFLILVLVVRLTHVLLLGSPLSGMNPKMAILAKTWMAEGFGETNIDVPPGPILLLAAGSMATGLPPVQLIVPVIVGSHLLFALAFWCWLRSLRVEQPLGTTSLVLFIVLPALNSYTGFDNFPVILAAAAFLGAAACWHQSADRRLSASLAAGLGLLSFSVAWFRGEYLLFAPLYLLVYALLDRLFSGAWLSRRTLAAAGILMACLVCGAVSVMTFHDRESGNFGLVPKDYSCWAFLDGTPQAWLSKADNSEVQRVERGIERFGHPSQYDYSLPKIVLANPGTTLLKAALNVPAWLYHLARRHAVVPLPVSLLAMIGLLSLLLPSSAAARAGWAAAALAAILMTLPLTGLLVSARYMLVALAGMCVLAGHGGLVLLSLIARRLKRPGSASRRLWWLGVALGAIVLECLLIRGGGLLRDAERFQWVAQQINQRFDDPRGPPLMLDPYHNVIDAQCEAIIMNRQLHLQRCGRVYFAERDPLLAAAAASPAVRRELRVVVWDKGEVDPERLQAWRRAGFVQAASATQPIGAGGYDVRVLQLDPNNGRMEP